MNDLNYRCPY